MMKTIAKDIACPLRRNLVKTNRMEPTLFMLSIPSTKYWTSAIKVDNSSIQ